MKLLVVFALVLSGCAHSVHQVYVSDFGGYAPLESGEVVRASAEQNTIMGFVTETNYVELATSRLVGKCPDGEITGITTQFSTSLGFFSWTNKILMQGLCLKGKRSARR